MTAFDIDKYRGQWVLVNFFATWCPPCVAEQPELVKFAADNAGSVQLVSVAFDDTTENVEQFFAERGGDWPVLAEETGAAAIDYGVVKLPESYLVDPSGTVVEKLIGGVRAADVQELVEARESGRDRPERRGDRRGDHPASRPASALVVVALMLVVVVAATVVATDTSPTSGSSDERLFAIGSHSSAFSASASPSPGPSRRSPSSSATRSATR